MEESLINEPQFKIKSASELIIFLSREENYDMVNEAIEELYGDKLKKQLVKIDDLLAAKSNIVKHILQNPKYNDRLRCDPEVEKSIDLLSDLLYIKNDDYVTIFTKFINNRGFEEKNFQLTKYDFVSMEQNKQGVRLGDSNNFAKLLKLICNMRDSLANFISIKYGVINENGMVDRSKLNESVVNEISQKTKELLSNFFNTNGLFAVFIQEAMKNKNIADYFRNIDLMTGKSIDKFTQMFSDINAKLSIINNNIFIVDDDNIKEQPSTSQITADVKNFIVESELNTLNTLNAFKNCMMRLFPPKSTSINNLSNLKIDNLSNSKSGKLSKRRILLLISIAISFLVSLGWALNIKFLVIAIANPWSIILAVGTFILFATLTYIANRYKVIKLSKLFCMDSDESFFNLNQPLENLPKSEKNIYDINKDDD
ncbi:MAG: hypothetical protein IJU86_02455 [Firmicutes bacterium]|nr:hypothetical protein [Bacillota bacterium]